MLARVWSLLIRMVDCLWSLDVQRLFFVPVPHRDLLGLPQLLHPRGVVAVLSRDPERPLVSMRPKRCTLVLDVESSETIESVKQKIHAK